MGNNMNDHIDVKDKNLCSGCYACYNTCNTNAINMEYDEDGFIYPIVDKSKCINCGQCVKTCPYNNHEIKLESVSSIYACYNIDEEVRSKSTSGGIFSLLAEYVLFKGGIVFGAFFDEQFNVIHGYTDKVDDLDKFRGSKYVQSNIGNSYGEAKIFLKQNRWVLFTGTTCQIEGLLNYLEKKYEKLLTMDFFCMGISSPVIWKKYLNYFHRKTITKITFKNKELGWHNWRIKFSYVNKNKYWHGSDNLYMNGYLNHLYYRPSCFTCQFKGIARYSDFTVADCWGIDKYHPEMDDNKGISTLITNTKKAINIFESIKPKIIYCSLTPEEATKYNRYALVSPSINPNSIAFFSELRLLPFKKVIKKYCSQPLKIRIVKYIKHLINHINDN